MRRAKRGSSFSLSALHEAPVRGRTGDAASPLVERGNSSSHERSGRAPIPGHPRTTQAFFAPAPPGPSALRSPALFRNDHLGLVAVEFEPQRPVAQVDVGAEAGAGNPQTP